MSYLRNYKAYVRMVGQNRKPRWWKEPIPITKQHIFERDTVRITQGIDRGVSGPVIAVDRARNKVKVKGAIMRRRKDFEKQAYVVDENWVHVTNVMLIDPVDNRPTRIRWRYLADGTRARIAVRSGALIARPEPVAEKEPPVNVKYDTVPEDVLETTYVPTAYYTPPTAASYGFFADAGDIGAAAAAGSEGQP